MGADHPFNNPRANRWGLILLLVCFITPLLACQIADQVTNFGSGPTPIPTNIPDFKNTSPELSPGINPQATDALATNPPVIDLRPTDSSTPTPLPLDYQLKIFNEVWKTVKENYLYPDFNGLDWDAMQKDYRKRIEAGLTNAEFYYTVDEMIYRLNDNHSIYLSPEQNAQQETEAQGKFDYVGIGTSLYAVPERQRAAILLVYPGSPAETAGLKSRDSILTVDGQTILDTNGFLKGLLLGEAGTQVTLTVQTPGDAVRQVVVTRQGIRLEPVIPHQVITSPAGKRIGYLLLPSLDIDNTGIKAQDALQEMSTQGPLDGLVIDDRQNPGGMDTELNRTMSLFIGGTLGHFVSRDEERPFRVLKARDIAGSLHYPLVVLTGKDTVSFGEIFAGILQDTGRGYIIGETTEGNVETLWNYDFEDGSRLWLAHEFFRPLNHPDVKWEGKGITPDLIVPAAWDEYTVETDPAVLAALNYIDTK